MYVAYTATETHDNLILGILDRSSGTLEARIHPHVDIFP